MARDRSAAPDPPPGAGDAAWLRVKELLADALERAPAERPAFLDQACRGDLALRAEVESLLGDADTSVGFLDAPAVDYLTTPAPEIGARIGRYTIRGVIGEGGMGRVYEATQMRPHRTVALKVLRPGFLAADAERRFRWEVDLLGRLSHPAIAQVHDAGVETTASGQSLSWFAMEKVAGKSLLVAADELRLDRTQRLELFVRVCDGVAHAHRRGVIHRDLKPDNILVDDDARPHIVDFGIARAADPLASAVTTTGAILGTLAYMSPEQLLGEPDRVDARSDVYALGVILFRLLTGAAPLAIDGLSLPQAARVIAEDEPRLAGAIDKALRGDLETILATALAREADRRYATVDALAADVRRALADEPILARQPTAWYQFSKFARRNRGLMLAVGCALAALLLAVIGTGIGLLRAERARRLAEGERTQADAARARAEVERDRVRAVNDFLNQLLASPDFDGREARVADLLDSAGADLATNLRLGAAVRGSLHLTLGETYRNLGLPEQALVHLQQALPLFIAEDGERADTTLQARGALCEVFAALGDLAAAEDQARRLRVAAEQRESSPPWLELRPLELESVLASASGDPLRSEAVSRELFEAWQRYEAEGSDAVETARNNLAVALLENGHEAEVVPLLTRGIEARGAVKGFDHPDVVTQRINLAQALAALGRKREALEQFEALEPLAIRAWGPTHPKVLSIRNNRANALDDLGRGEEALLIFEQLLRVRRELYGAGHRESVIATNNVAVALLRREDYQRAAPLLQASLTALDEQPGDEDASVLRIRTEMNLAAALEGLGELAEARGVSARVVERLEQLIGPAHPQTLIARNNYAMLLMAVGETGDAVAVATRNLTLARAEQPGDPQNVFPFQMNLGRALAAMGRFAESEVELLAVAEHLRTDENALPGQRERIRQVLADTYTAWGRQDAAQRWRD